MKLMQVVRQAAIAAAIIGSLMLMVGLGHSQPVVNTLEIDTLYKSGELGDAFAVATIPGSTSFLVSERSGKLLLVNAGGKVHQLQGLPDDVGEITEVAFADGVVYFCAARDGATRIIRAALKAEQLSEVRTIYAAAFGGVCKIALRGDQLFASTGYGAGDLAQDLSKPQGKIIRIRTDGAIPPDNPFADLRGIGWLPEIWSYGHRSPEGLAFDPATGDLWEHEHGPRGGDELNLIQRGANYGWPRTSRGLEYFGEKIGPPEKDKYYATLSSQGIRLLPANTEPVYFWTPSIAPSGMAFWDGALWIGALKGRALIRLTIEDRRVTSERRFEVQDRVRDVRRFLMPDDRGPSDQLLVLTDGDKSKLLRIYPEPKGTR